MAKSRGFGQFGRRMVFVGKTVAKNSEKAVRRAALAMDAVAVGTTPVDTGRARGNWIVSIGNPDLRIVDIEGSDTGQAAIEQGRGTIGRWKLRQGPIFISNSLPYIQALDSGSSAQAPSGMTDQAIKAGQFELKKARLLKRL